MFTLRCVRPRTKVFAICLSFAPLFALAAPLPAFAGGLHIHPVFMEGEPPPPGSIAGGGNLQAIFEAAAKRWERVFSKGPNWDITIEYEWAPLTGVWYGQAKLMAQGGNPTRPTRSFVQFRSGETPDGAFDWFADPTPENNSHYEHYESLMGEVVTGPPDFLPAGEVNVGRVFSTETGPAAGRIDLLTVAMHEIGHALGLDENYAGNRGQCPGDGLVIKPPRPFAGIFFFLAQCTHMDGFGDPLPVMVTLPTPGWRNLISAADALVIAQLTSFPKPDLGEPPGVPHVQELHCCRFVLGSVPTTIPVPDIAD